MNHWYVATPHPEIERMLREVARIHGWECGARCREWGYLSTFAPPLPGRFVSRHGATDSCGEQVDVAEAVRRLKAGPPKPMNLLEGWAWFGNDDHRLTFSTKEYADRQVASHGGRVVHLAEKPHVDDVDWEELAKAVWQEHKHVHGCQRSVYEWHELSVCDRQALTAALRTVIGGRFCRGGEQE